MKNKHSFLIVILTAFTCLFGCAHSTPSRFYTLSAMAKPTEAKFPHAISVGPVLIPPVVDRPQMVTRLGQNQVKFDEFNRWAVPLQKDTVRVIAENLAVKLGFPRITVFPQTPPDASAVRITVDFRTFESSGDKIVTIDALWTIRTSGEYKNLTRRTTYQESWKGAGYDDQVNAYSRALEKLSNDIALALLNL